MEYTRKVGWGGGGRYYHVVVRLDEPKAPEKVACGARLELIVGREPKAKGARCAKCVAYAKKRGWA